MANEKRFKLDMGFDEALRRFARTDKKELEDAAVKEFAKRNKKAKERINDAREEIKRGARSGRRPFRL